MSVIRRTAALVTVLWAPFVASLGAQGTKNVLVLHSGMPDQPGTAMYSAVLHKTFAAETRYQLFEYYLEENRLHHTDDEVADILSRTFAGKRMDVVIADGKPALTFFLNRGALLWPGAAGVFDFVQERQLPPNLPANLTGVAFTYDFASTVDLALRLMPDTRRVFYIGPLSADQQGWRGYAEQDFRRFAGRVEFTYVDYESLGELLARVKQLPEHSVVFYSAMFADPHGNFFTPTWVSRLVSSAANVPVFGMSSSYIGSGVVGGAVMDVNIIADSSSRLALRVAEAGTVSNLPIQRIAPTRVEVDWRQLQRWGVAAAVLPPGAVVDFRPPSVWEQYHWQVTGILAAAAVLLSTIAALLVERQRRLGADAAVMTLSGRLIHAGEEERRRIARELHDDVLQRLSLVSSDLAASDREVQVSDAAGRTSTHDRVRELNEIISAVRHVSHELHSSKLEFLGLSSALRELCEQLSKQYGIAVDFAGGGESRVSDEVALCFYRVAQEALSNALKHGDATHVEVWLAFDATTVSMTILDNGIGFETGRVARGLGLATMQERLRLVGGRLVVRSRTGAGTRITAEAKLTLPHYDDARVSSGGLAAETSSPRPLDGGKQVDRQEVLEHHL